MRHRRSPAEDVVEELADDGPEERSRRVLCLHIGKRRERAHQGSNPFAWSSSAAELAAQLATTRAQEAAAKAAERAADAAERNTRYTFFVMIGTLIAAIAAAVAAA
jgi:hypothetical protein